MSFSNTIRIGSIVKDLCAQVRVVYNIKGVV